MPAETEIAGWLIVPYINKALQNLLRIKGLTAEHPLPGLSLIDTKLFPLVIVEYNKLPLDEAFCELKTFMKSGQDLRQAMELSLRKWTGSKLYDEYTTIISSIHNQEARTVIEILEQDKKKIKSMAEWMLEKLGDEAETLEPLQRLGEKSRLEGRLEGRLETARKMKADGLPIDAIGKYTGLSRNEIDKL